MDVQKKKNLTNFFSKHQLPTETIKQTWAETTLFQLITNMWTMVIRLIPHFSPVETKPGIGSTYVCH
jgi:hypothetical protein